MNQQSPTYRQTTISDNGVAAKLEAILARVGDRVKTGNVLFDARGERHARAIAAADVAFETCVADELSPEGPRHFPEPDPFVGGQRTLALCPGSLHGGMAVSGHPRSRATYLPSRCNRSDQCNNG